MWVEPVIVEIDMNAEIGAYQQEDDGEENLPVVEATNDE
jgi:hypothetical protein